MNEHLSRHAETDYCNSLLADLPLNAICPLKMIQNTVELLVFTHHSTADFQQLHASDSKQYVRLHGHLNQIGLISSRPTNPIAAFT